MHFSIIIACPNCKKNDYSYNYTGEYLINRLSTSWLVYFCPNCKANLREKTIFTLFDFFFFLILIALPGLVLNNKNIISISAPYLLLPVAGIIILYLRLVISQLLIVYPSSSLHIKGKPISPQKSFPILFFYWGNMLSITILLVSSFAAYLFEFKFNFFLLTHYLVMVLNFFLLFYISLK